jgi:hypothetical protein
MLVNLGVSPDKLSAEPQRTPQGQQHPERIFAPVRRYGIHQKNAIHEQRQRALENVRKRSAAGAGGDQYGHGSVNAKQQQAANGE